MKGEGCKKRKRVNWEKEKKEGLVFSSIKTFLCLKLKERPDIERKKPSYQQQLLWQKRQSLNNKNDSNNNNNNNKNNNDNNNNNNLPDVNRIIF